MIVYLPGALRDLRGIANWYKSERPEGEARFFQRLAVAVRQIEREPTGFPLALEDIGVRKARVLRSPYSVAYLVRRDEVRIVAVIHGARRPGFWTHRLREESGK
jgi:plasmid stabilization system protein ParE